MDAALIVTWAAAAALVVAGLAGLVLPALPGPLLLFAGLWTAAWAEDFAYVGMKTLVVLAVIATLALVAEIIAGAFGARHYGASMRSVTGATVGAIVGMFFGLPGLLLGPFAGALIGELTTRRCLVSAGRAGWGATVGLVLGTAAKLALGFTMIGLFSAVRLF